MDLPPEIYVLILAELFKLDPKALAIMYTSVGLCQTGMHHYLKVSAGVLEVTDISLLARALHHLRNARITDRIHTLRILSYSEKDAEDLSSILQQCKRLSVLDIDLESHVSVKTVSNKRILTRLSDRLLRCSGHTYYQSSSSPSLHVSGSAGK